MRSNPTCQHTPTRGYQGTVFKSRFLRDGDLQQLPCFFFRPTPYGFRQVVQHVTFSNSPALYYQFNVPPDPLGSTSSVTDMVLWTPSPYPSARVEKISHGTSSIYSWYSTSAKLYVVWQSPTQKLCPSLGSGRCWHLACPNPSQLTCPVSLDRQQRLGRRKGRRLRHTSNRYPAVVALSGSGGYCAAYGWTKRQEPLAIAGSSQTTGTPCQLRCMNGQAN